MFQKTLQEIAAIVKKYDHFLITGTADADGDSIGAQLALKEIILTQIRHNKDKVVEIVNEDRCPLKYAFLPGSETIKTPRQNKIKDFDAVFILDGGIERTGTVKSLADRARIKILVDHHKFGSQERYDLSLHNPKASSTAEIVYHFLESSDWQVKLTPEMAACLYLGLIFDTGFFTYSLTSPKTLHIAEKLLKTGIDFPKIAHKGMKEKRLISQILLGRVLTEVKLNHHRNVIYSVISKDMIEETKATPEDSEGIIEQIFLVENIKVAILFKEQKDLPEKGPLHERVYKLSFRSDGTVDVGSLCRELAGEKGGGHAQAAGCLLKGELSAMVQMLFTRLEQLLKTVG